MNSMIHKVNKLENNLNYDNLKNQLAQYEQNQYISVQIYLKWTRS